MDPVIDKINEIERAASRIMEEAANTNRQLDTAHEVRIRAADLEAEEETEKRLTELRKTLEDRLESEKKSLEANTEHTLQELDAYYQANRTALADSIFENIIRK